MLFCCVKLRRARHTQKEGIELYAFILFPLIRRDGDFWTKPMLDTGTYLAGQTRLSIANKSQTPEQCSQLSTHRHIYDLFVPPIQYGTLALIASQSTIKSPFA